MKNSILFSLAIVSIILSYFYEQPSHLPAVPAQPVTLQTASLFSLPAPENIIKNTATDNPTYKDSLFYNYYAQTLGLKLNHTENKELIETVSDWLGTPYRSGASSKKGTDCSGFVTRVYKKVYGIDLSHSSRSMFNQVKRVKKDEVQEGDLVFFRRGPGQPIYHVGIYLKNNKFVHSASSGGVRISSLNEQYYRRNYYAVGRAL